MANNPKLFEVILKSSTSMAPPIPPVDDDAVALPVATFKLEAFAKGGVPPYSYEFFHKGVTIQSGDENFFAASQAGGYAVWAYDSEGEFATSKVIVIRAR